MSLKPRIIKGQGIHVSNVIEINKNTPLNKHDEKLKVGVQKTPQAHEGEHRQD